MRPPLLWHSLYAITYVWNLSYHCNTINQWFETAFSGSVLFTLIVCFSWCQWEWECVHWIGMPRNGRGESKGEKNLPRESFWIRKLLATLSTHSPNWQVLLRDELSPWSSSCLICSTGKCQGKQPDQTTMIHEHSRKSIVCSCNCMLTCTYCKHVSEQRHDSRDERQRNVGVKEMEELQKMKGEDGKQNEDRNMKFYPYLIHKTS